MNGGDSQLETVSSVFLYNRLYISYAPPYQGRSTSAISPFQNGGITEDERRIDYPLYVSMRRQVEQILNVGTDF